MKLSRKNDNVKIPEGFFCSGRCCADCVYMDLNDENKYGDYYCGKKQRYYPGGDSVCSNFQWK